MNEAPLLRVDKLEVVYHRTITAVQGISLAAEAGQIVAVLGTNGAGKSTTLRAISGFLGIDDARITDGSVTFKGRRIENRPPNEIARLGVVLVPERDKVFPNLTVAENLAAPFAPSARGRSASEEFVYAAFPRLADLRRRTAGLLSGGERQMLALGSALVCRPELLLVDELSLGLAPAIVEELMARLVQIRRDLGLTIVLVEQNAAAALAGRLRLRPGERPLRSRRRQCATARARRHSGVLSRPVARRRASQLPRGQAVSAQPEMVWLSLRSRICGCGSAASSCSTASRSRSSAASFWR
jgi:branched-chain amino acid transport system ATP-binding protein